MSRSTLRSEPITAATRRFDHKDITRHQFGRVGTREEITAAVLALDPLPSDSSVGSAVEPERGNVAAGGHDHRGHRFKKANAPSGSIAAPPLPVTARTAANRELFQPHRIAQLQH